MSINAPIRTGYSVRILIISLALIGGGLWFLYDGMIGYPRKQQMYETYEQIRREHPSDWNSRWQAHAREQGWPIAELPEQYTDGQIMLQLIIGGTLVPLGVAAGVFYVRLRGRWIVSDNEGLSTSWGERASWEAIRSLDKSRWKRKGIAVVHYDVGGTQRRITFDDWKYDTAAIEQMVQQIDAHVSGGAAASEAQAHGEEASGAGAEIEETAERLSNNTTGAAQPDNDARQ